jgi:hypothetical protein
VLGGLLANEPETAGGIITPSPWKTPDVDIFSPGIPTASRNGVPGNGRFPEMTE